MGEAVQSAMRFGEMHKLSTVVLAAVSARIVTLWVTRPEFAGWFNHTYYYFVQVRGLLREGSLPYPDMPLLFLIDSWVARGAMALGLSLEDAVVAATRIVMCVVPALVAVPIYRIVRNVNDGRPLRPVQWVFVASAGFLPLSLSHLPEMLQKNMLGLLLLACLMLFSQRWLRRRDLADVVAVALLIVATVLSHYGSFAATMLYGVALIVALVMVADSLRPALVAAALLSLVGILSVGLIYALDPRRFYRLLEYIVGSVGGSVVGALLGVGSERSGLLGSVLALVAFYALLAVLFLVYRRRGSDLPIADRVFWLATLLFCGLLLLPVLDQRLMGRLGLFVSLPLLVVLIHLERHALDRPRLGWLIPGGVALAVLLLAVGELASSRVHNAEHAAVLADLESVRDRALFGPGDLVITPTGAEHLSNWFFGVDAGVITSLRRDDFERYRRIYVLNPIEGVSNLDGIEGRAARSERDRYQFMRRNIPRPSSVEPLLSTDHLEVFELAAPPAEWAFDADGGWIGYSVPEVEGRGPRP